MAVAAVLLLAPMEQNNAIKKAESYLDAGQYRQALDALGAVKENDEVSAVKAKVYKAVEAELDELYDDEEYEDVLDMLSQWEDLPEYNRWMEKAVEDGVQQLMNEGEYVEAHEMLEQYPDVECYDKLNKYLKFETYILEAAFDYRPILKNPSSLQVSEAEFYIPSSDFYEDDVEVKYPCVILNTSGQNSYGGYSGGLTVHAVKSLKYMGSTNTMDPYDADDEDELYAILLIQAHRDESEEITDVEYDLSRINGFLESGKKPNIAPELYTIEVTNTKET